MSCMVFIPSYWKDDDLNTWEIFDHPASMSEDGTLGRTLQNLMDVGFDLPVAVLPVPCVGKVIDKTKRICGGYSRVTVIDSQMLGQISSRLLDAGMKSEELALIDCRTYGGVRNIGLACAMINGFDQVFMMDDDECLSSDYEKTIQRHIGTEIDGTVVLGKCGCVEDGKGRKVYDGQQGEWGASWPKDRLFNDEVRGYLDANRKVVRSNLGFGGNSVIDKRLFSKVPFDPFVARGEDDDYTLNCRHCGEAFFFDQDMLLLHLPPKRTKAFWTRHRQDFIRFAYVREKLKAFGMEPDDLGSFLSHFTRCDLEKKAVLSSIEAASFFIDEDIDEAKGFLETAKIALCVDKKNLRARAESFMRLIDSWRKAMAVIGGI